MTQNSTSTTNSYSRGDVLLALVPVSSGQSAKARPAVVVQSDLCTTEYDQFVILPITSRQWRTGWRFRLPVMTGASAHRVMGLRTDSVILVDQPTVLLGTDVRRKLGICPADMMKVIERELRFVLGIR